MRKTIFAVLFLGRKTIIKTTFWIRFFKKGNILCLLDSEGIRLAQRYEFNIVNKCLQYLESSSNKILSYRHISF